MVNLGVPFGGVTRIVLANVICLWLVLQDGRQSSAYSDLAATEDDHVCDLFGDLTLPLADSIEDLNNRNELTDAPAERPSTSMNGAIAWD
jgi:hypothetical protein